MLEDGSARHHAPRRFARRRRRKRASDNQRRQRVDPALLHWNREAVLPEIAAAPDLWATIEPLPYAQQLDAVRSEPRFHTWGFAVHCVRWSAALVSTAPGEARRAANLALAAIDELDPAYDEDWICDLSALALAHLADARREMRELAAAGEAIDRALRRWADGTGSIPVEAEILFREALLRRDEKHLAEAAALLTRVHAIHSQPDATEDTAPDPHAAGVALLHRAWCHHHLACPGDALEGLDRAAALLDPSHDAGLGVALHSGRTWCLLRLGQLDEAAVAAGVATELACALGDRGAEVRLRLVRLRIPGEHLPAEETLRGAAQELLDLGLELDAALVFLDLADHLLRGAQLDQVPPLADEVLPVFCSPEIGREEFAVLLLFQQACVGVHEGKLTPELLHELACLLERRRRPSLAWWSARGVVLGEAAPSYRVVP